VRPEQIAERLAQRYPDTFVAREEVTVTVEPEALLATLEEMRTDEELSFDWLSDVSATDWPDRSPRFWVAYHLYSTAFRHRLRIKVGVEENEPRVASVTGLFPTANWLEREVFDLMGIVFDDHPDLRRILMPDDWEGYPHRKTEGMGGVTTRFKNGAFIPPVDERIGGGSS